MDARTFLDNFAAIAEAPLGVQRLRGLVLDLGLGGRLTGQTPSDGSVSTLLSDSRRRLERAAEQGEVQKLARARPVTREPHPVPRGWEWEPLGSLVAILDFRRKAVKQEERLARIRGKSDCDLYPYYGATQQAGVIDDYLFDEELVLLGEDGAPFLSDGKHVAYVVSGKYWVNNHVHALRGLAVRNRYLAHALNRVDFADFVTGTTRLKLTQGKMIHLPIPVPPLAEQDRIIEKVDELMGLCDELESCQERRQSATTRFRGSALHALTRAEAPDDLLRAWQRVSTNWPALTDEPDSIPELRQAILKVAMEGRLGGHDVEPGRVTTLESVVSLQNGYAFKSEWFSTEGIPLVRCQNIGHGQLRWNDQRTISAERASKFQRFDLRLGDIVLALDRPLISTGLKVARIQKCDLPSLLLQRVARLVSDPERIDTDYLWLWLHSPAFIGSVDPGRSNGVPHISTKEVGAIEIRLPSLERQRATVRQAEHLLGLCGALGSALIDNAQSATTLANLSAERWIAMAGASL